MSVAECGYNGDSFYHGFIILKDYDVNFICMYVIQTFRDARKLQRLLESDVHHCADYHTSSEYESLNFIFYFLTNLKTNVK